MSLIVARKEIKEIITTKSKIIAGLGFTLYFSMFSALALVKSGSIATLNNSVFYLALVIGIFTAYIFSGQVFFREKREGVIETLLCTPLSLRALMLGKVIGVTVPAYLLSLLSVISIIVATNYFSHSLLLPSPVILLHIFLAVPAFIASAIALMGFLQLLLGMRENQIINLLLFAVLFGALFGMGGIMKSNFVITWLHVIALLAISVLLLSFTAFLTRYLSRERIVTTIP